MPRRLPPGCPGFVAQRSKDRLEEIRAEHRETSEWLLGVFGEVISGTQHALAPREGQPAPELTKAMAEQVGRMVLSTLTKAGGLEQVAGAHEDVSSPTSTPCRTA